MAYRDTPSDARVAELTARIASDPDLRAELARIQREHTALTELADVAGPRFYEAEAELDKRRAGGVIATVTGWFGASIEEHEAEVARLRSEHVELTTKIDTLTAAEGAVSAQLRGVTEARAELERLDKDAVDRLRATEGADGDTVRALDADDVRDKARRGVIERAIDAGDFARSALSTVDAIIGDLGQVTGVASSVLGALQRIDEPFTTPSAVEDRANVRARLADAIAFAGERLAELVTTYDAAELTWLATMPRARVLELAASPVADPTEASALAKNSEPVVTCIGELIKVLVTERERLDRSCADRDVQRRSLADRVRA